MVKTTQELIDIIQKRIDTETDLASKLDMIVLKSKLLSCINRHES